MVPCGQIVELGRAAELHLSQPGSRGFVFQDTIEYMSEKSVRSLEPRWPAALALGTIGALYYALPSALTFGPDWLVLVLVAALAIPATIFHRQGNWRFSQLLGYAEIGRAHV